MPTPADQNHHNALLKGSVFGSVWAIAWPTLIQSLVGGLQGLVDHAMVGHYIGLAGNAAIGVSWQIFLVVIVFISSIVSGMAVLVARFAGAGETDKVNRVVYQALLTGLALASLVLAPIGYFLTPTLLRLIKAEPAVIAEAQPYLSVMFIGGAGMLMFFMVGGALRAAGDAKTPLRLGIAMTLMNLAFNVILIRGLGPIPAFGTLGAAIGTVLAATLVSIYAFYLLFSGRLVVHFQRRMGWRPDFRIIRRLFKFGLPTGIQGIAMNIGGIVLLRYVGSLEQSAETQAIYTVGYTQLFAFITFTATSLLAASATITGQNLGAGLRERALSTPRNTTLLGLAVAIPVGLLFLLIPGTLLGIFGMTDPAVVALGSRLLAYLSVSGIFLCTALAYTGALQGSGDTRSPLYISLVSQLVLPLGLCAFFDAYRGGLLPEDIWLAIVLGHLLRALLSIARFQQGRWSQIQVALD